MEGDDATPERAGYRDPSRPSRGSLGRRSGDYDDRTTITKRLLVVVVAIVNALYLVAEAIITGQNLCP
jgi:hypothetical protein